MLSDMVSLPHRQRAFSRRNSDLRNTGVCIVRVSFQRISQGKDYIMNIKLANGLSVIILAWFTAAGVYAEDSAEVPIAHDLAADAQEAKTRGVPIMLVFGSRNCTFCLILNRDFLRPMRRNPEYEAKVMMRRIDTTANAALRDFSGKTTTHARFAKEHRIKLTPTIKWFDSEGHEPTEPLIGLSTPDYYGGFLDQRIDAALAKVRAEK